MDKPGIDGQEFKITLEENWMSSNKLKNCLPDEVDLPSKEKLLEMYEQAKIKPLTLEDLKTGDKGKMRETLLEIFRTLFWGKDK